MNYAGSRLWCQSEASESDTSRCHELAVEANSTFVIRISFKLLLYHSKPAKLC